MNNSTGHLTTAGHPLSVVAGLFAESTHGTLSDRLYSALRKAILSGDLPPQTKLREVDLATVVPISRTPIREALKRLRADGLLSVSANRALEVHDIDLLQCLDTYAILEVLEPLTARLAAERITDSQVTDLRDSVDLTEFFFSKGRWDDVTRESQRFHELIYEAGGNKKLVQVIHRLREEAHRFRRFWTRNEEFVRLSIIENREIVDALARRDAVAAYDLMYQHLNMSTNRIRALIDQADRLGTDGKI